MANPYQGMISPVAGAAVEPPSLIPQINTLGGLVDSFVQKRMAMQEAERKLAADEAKDRYYRERNALADRKEAARQRGEWMKHNQQQAKEFRLSPEAGTRLLYNVETGELVPVDPQPRGKPLPAIAPPPPAQPQGNPRELGEKPAGTGLDLRLTPPSEMPGRRPGLTGLSLRPPAAPPPAGDMALEPPAFAPSAQVISAPASRIRGFRGRPPSEAQTVFYDENNDGDIQALTGPNDEQIVELQQDSFPPGAREGQRFNRNDVGFDGRKGNPFAEPLPLGYDVTVDQVEDGDARVLVGDDPRLQDLPVDRLPPGAREGQTFRGDDVGLGAGRMNPDARPKPLGYDVTVDQINEGDNGDMASVLIGDDPRLQDLPVERLPPGAREGQRFRGDDVGLGAGRMNPDAKPLPPVGVAEAQKRLQERPQGESQVTSVPPAEARGAFHDMRGQAPSPAQPAQPQGQGEQWVLQIPGGGEIVVDREMQRRAKLAEAEAMANQIEQALASGAVDPRIQPYLANRAAALRAMLPEKAQGQMQGFAQQTSEREGRQEYGAEQLKTKHQMNLELEAAKQKGREILKNMGKRGGGGAGSLRGWKIPLGQGPGSYDWIDIPRLRGGQRRPDHLLKTVDQAFSRLSSDTKLAEQLKGYRRVAMAQHNIAQTGPDAGVVNVEAAFNYLGAVRGGVPVKNESDEMLGHRRTYGQRLRAVAVNSGIGAWYDKWVATLSGRNLSDAEMRDILNNQFNQMSPEEKRKIALGIQETYDVMSGQVAQSIEPFVQQYATLRGPGAQLMRKYAVSLVNGRLRAADLPGDFQPFDESGGPSATPTRGGTRAGASRAAPTSSAGGGGAEDFNSILKQLVPPPPAPGGK